MSSSEQFAVGLPEDAPNVYHDFLDLHSFLAKQDGIRLHLVNHYRFTPLVELSLLSAAAYVGKKGVDILAELIQKWLDKRPDSPTVTIYDENGKVIKVVKKSPPPK